MRRRKIRYFAVAAGKSKVRGEKWMIKKKKVRRSMGVADSSFAGNGVVCRRYGSVTNGC